MRFAQITYDRPDKGFSHVRNVSGGTLSGNHPACLTTTAASLDGHNAVAPASSQVRTLKGVLDKDLADLGYGVVQTYGYRDSVRIFAHGTSVTIAVDSPMGPAAGSNGFSSSGLKDQYGPAVVLEAIGAAICSPGGYAKAFLRCL